MKKRNFLHLITFFISIFAAHSIKTDCKTFENFVQSSLNHHLGTTTSKAIILLRVAHLVQAFTYRIVACGEPRLRMTKVCAFLLYLYYYKNTTTFNIYKTIKYKKDIINTLSTGDTLFNKKILVEVLEDNKYSYYLVDNTSKNRSLTGLDKIWCVDESILPNLEVKLNNGETLYETESTIWYGIEDIKDKEMEWHEDELIKESEEFINDVINDLSYDEYYTFRDEQKTQELLAELNDIDLKEIRDKYFTLEEVCCE